MSNDVPVISFFDENAESDGADFFLSLSSSNEAQNSKPLKEYVDNLFVAQDNNTQLQNGSPPTTPKEVPVTAPEPTPIVQEAPTSIESVYEQKQPASPDTNQRQTTSTAPKPTAKKPETPPPISIFDSDDDSPGASSFFDSLSQSAIQSMAATPKSEPSYVQPLTQSFNSMTVQETPQPQPQTQPVQSNIRVSGTHQTPFTPYQPPSVSGHHYSSIPAPVTPFPATTHFATPSSVPAPSIPRPSMPNVFTPSMPSNMPAPTTFSTFVPTAYPNPVPAAVPFVPTPQPAPMPSFTPFTPSLTPQPTSMPNVFTPTPAVPSVSAPKYVAPPQSIPLPSVAPVSKPPTLPPVVPTMPTVPMAMPNVFTPSPVPSVPAPMHSSMPTPSVPQTIPSIPPQMASPFSASPVNTPPFTPPTMPKNYVPPTIPAPAPLHHSMPAPSIPAHRHSNSLSNVTFPRPQSVVAMEEIQAHTLPAIQQIQTDAQMNRSHSLPQLHGATFAPFPQNPLSMSQSFVPTASFGDATQTGNYLDSLRKPRPVVCFGFGGRLAVMMPQKHGAVAAPTSTPFNVLQPSDASLTIVKILSLSKLLQHTPYMKNLLSFSGPLHGMSQDKVLKMLSERIENEEKNVTSIYDFDNVLLLKLLRVICQHHGMFAPSQADSKDALAAIKNMLSEGTTAHTVNPLIPSKPQEEIEGIMELQALVLAGRVEDAYKYAMGRQLWNHALILSSSLGPEAFKNTVSNYAQTNLMEGAPLRTLYLRLYGKTQDIFQPSMPSLSLSSNTITPAAGLLEYWRENLVALLGNAQSKPIIGSLGDRLWSQQRRVSAAHICYLLAEHEIDSFDNPNSRVVLLGADHKTSVRTFVTAEACQRTELLEYAKSLGNSQFSMPSLDVFRLVYAYFLAEVGLLDVAKKYHQQVETNMHKNKSFQYNPHVKYLLLDLQNRLHIAQNKKGAAPGGSWITLPSFGSLFNKGISKLIGTEDDQGGAQGYPPAAHHHQPMPQQGHARTYSSGNVVPPMAFPPAAQPMPQQAHPPANQSPQASPRKKEEDDLGLGNNSFSTPKKKDSTDDTTSTSKDGTQASSISSRLSGFFSPLFRRGTPVADLGQENQFEYNKELGMWLKKGEQPDPAALARRGAPAPPPTMAYIPPPPTTMSGPPSDGSTPPGGSPMPQGPPAFSNAARGGRRQRYVDTLNPDAPAQRAAVPPSQPPGMPGLTPMTPMAPMSTMTPMVPAVFTPQGSSESTYEAPTYSYPPPEPTENGPPS